jgi:hypothetical protein
VVSSRDTRRIYRRFRVEIHHFPQVQILGNHAKIREGRQYIDLGFYNSDGTFEWSPEGAARRDALLSPEVVLDEEEAPVQEAPVAAQDPLSDDLAAARERNAARHKKQNRRGQ